MRGPHVPVLALTGRGGRAVPASPRRLNTSGGVVRIVDLRRRKVLEYRSQERPACLAGMPDDLPALWQAQHER